MTTIPVRAEEFLLNPSFELGVGPIAQDWNLSASPCPNRNNSSLEATNGNYLLVIQPGGAAWQSFSPAVEGEEWTFAGYIKNASLFQLSGDNAGLLSIRFLGPSMTSRFDSPLFEAERARDAWFPWSVTAVAPPDTVSVEFWLTVTDNDPYGVGGLMFDDFGVSTAPVPEPAALPFILLGVASLLLRRNQILERHQATWRD